MPQGLGTGWCQGTPRPGRTLVHKEDEASVDLRLGEAPHLHVRRWPQHHLAIDRGLDGEGDLRRRAVLILSTQGLGADGGRGAAPQLGDGERL